MRALRSRFELLYVDPFCGSGLCETNSDRREDREVHHGSALRAFSIPDYSFDRVVLNDIEHSKVEALRRRVDSEFPERDVEYHSMDANEFIELVFDRQERSAGWQGTRGVVFLDPFATQVSWSSIEKIADTQSLDLWMLFPRKALSRVAPNRVGEDLDHHPHRDTLDRVFGDDSWRQMYDDDFKSRYEQKTHVERAWQPMLGGLEAIDPESSIRGPEAMIAYLYRERLKSVLPQVSNVRAALYINGQPHFELIFAVSNPSPRAGQLATKVADYILENHSSVQIKD